MKKFLKQLAARIRRHRNLRLYSKLFEYYKTKEELADTAGMQAADAFEWLTGYRWPADYRYDPGYQNYQDHQKKLAEQRKQ